MKSITVQELKQKMENEEGIALVDVREDREVALASINGSIHIPMMAIPYQLDTFKKDEPLYLLCHTGVRSAQACIYLEQQGFHAVNVTGGIHAWSLEIEPEVPTY